jgi:conjugative transposon TraN protein
MFKTTTIWLCLTLVINFNGTSQQSENKEVHISFNKTTSLIFPFAITSVDRGSKDVLVQKARGVENVLLVKAGKKEFSETNLTIITADGILHPITVNYSEQPPTQTITVANISALDDRTLIFVEDAVNARDVQTTSEHVLLQKSAGRIEGQNKSKMSFKLQSISINNDLIYYRVQIRNKSAITYDVKSLKFYIRDKKKVKRTSSQEIEAVPVYIGNNKTTIPGYASADMVFALRKFTIPDGKVLDIELFEQNGGRNLNLKIDNRDILKARSITTTKNLLTTIKK